MISESQKENLLQEIGAYLDEFELTSYSAHEKPDLASVFTELASLKSEVKIEARQFKTALDTLNDALNYVEKTNQVLTIELDAYAMRLQQQRLEILRPMLLEMVDLYDRFSTGLDVLHHYRPVSSLFKKSRKQDVRFITSFRQGQELSLKRFEQVLQKQRVYPIRCLGKMLDPHTMNAVEIDRDPKIDNGIVLEELRKGFLFEDQVLRIAEVKVNKL
ncbi:MAG: nucleotide exchange factor GrpE [Methylovulum sp.]|jgi:molecular chaperone GrpE|nr:nucleotide exchange factor GrpE [Methylovulum sp.]MCF7998222.1 nucleotide exchange factor GrpE [Methylovulum sp.]